MAKQNTNKMSAKRIVKGRTKLNKLYLTEKFSGKYTDFVNRWNETSCQSTLYCALDTVLLHKECFKCLKVFMVVPRELVDVFSSKWPINYIEDC